MNNESNSWETAKVEYENALAQYRYYTGLRRQDMAFVTTVQAAIMSIIGKNLLDLNFADLLISIIAFFVLLLGINNERRLSAYMTGYMNRAKIIESKYSMSLLEHGWQEIKNRKLLFSNSVTFKIFYIIFIICWFCAWALNLI